LRLCEGDCDTDSDCKGDLVCFKRSQVLNSPFEPVPGCDGAGVRGKDYCIENSVQRRADRKTTAKDQAVTAKTEAVSSGTLTTLTEICMSAIVVPMLLVWLKWI